MHDDQIPGIASDFIRHFEQQHQSAPIKAVVVYCRVSGRQQKKDGNLRNQKIALRRSMGECGVTIKKVFQETVSGWITDHKKRSKLVEAAELAARHGIPILAFSTNRFIRNREYKSNNRNLQPTVQEFTELQDLTASVMLLTWLHPDMSEDEVSGVYISLGQTVRNHFGGRPQKKFPGEKKAIRLEKQAKAIRLWRTGNWSMEIIAGILGVPKSTVQNWVKKYPKKNAPFLGDDGRGS